MSPEQLAALATRYAATRGIQISTLATYAAADSRFFQRLSEGRVTIRRMRSVAQYLSDNWPEYLEWPADIPRPESSASEEAAS